MKKIVLYLLVLLSVSVFADGNQVSKKELFDRARDVLRESLEGGDYDKAGQALEYLQENISNGAPLTVNEEYYAYMGMHRYEDALRVYFEGRRVYLDVKYHPDVQKRVIAEDGLSLYFSKLVVNLTKASADSLMQVIDASEVSQESKDLYGTLLYSELVIGHTLFYVGNEVLYALGIWDDTYVEPFFARARDFVQKYPNSIHSEYLNRDIIPMVQKHLDFLANPLEHKFYTGGYGIYASLWWGGITGDAADYIQMDMGSYMLEFEMQFWRVNFGAFYAWGIEGKRKYRRDLVSQSSDYDDGYSIGFTAGFDVFDSKYVKVVPFIGLGSTTIDALEIDAHNHFLLGTNVDLRLWTSKAKKIGSPIVSLHLRLKYMAKFSSYKDSYVNVEQIYDEEDGHYIGREDHHLTASGDYVNHAFSIGLGLYWW